MNSFKNLSLPIVESMPDSLWAATAEPWPSNHLHSDIETEILIIGAGFTGLSAALHFGEYGHKVTVVDAVEPGYGASGRNGGQVIPGLKLYPDEVIKHFGHQQGERIIHSTNTSADLVFDLINKYKIDCHASHNGFVQPAFSSPSCNIIENRVLQLNQYGANVELIDKKLTAEYLGSDAYHIALLDRRGGCIQPLSYAQGLAKAAIKLGAQIFTHAPVSTISKDGNHWIAQTNLGKVKSKQVIICTNAYSNLSQEQKFLSPLSKSIIPLYSFQVATQPLNEELLSTILPCGHAVADTRRLLNYFRLDHTGRLVFGGRGGVNDAKHSSDYDHIVKRITAVFPQIKTPKLDYYWSGKVALTLDGVPHIHQLGSGLYAGLGFNGRGVGMATLMGKWLANLALNKQLGDECIPFSLIKPIQFQNFRKPVISMAYLFKAVRDKMEGYQSIR